MLYNKILESVYYLAGKTTKFDAWIKYQALMKNQRLPRGELEKLQWKKLKAILAYSYDNIPFYKNKFDIVKLKPGDINDPKDLLLIPVTTKEELLNAAQPLDPELSSAKLEWIQTSGTTGTPLNWPFDIKSYNTKYALFLRGCNFMDWKLGDKIASLWWPRHSSYNNESFALIKKIVYLFAHRRRLYPPIANNSTDINLKSVQDIYNDLKLCPPAVFESSTENFLFLSFLMEENELAPLKIKNISVAGLLTENLRKRFKKDFQGEVFNRYGPHEMEGIAHECSEHQGLHLSIDSYFLECLKEDGKPAMPDECGEFVITDLDNYIQPFIRYKIGDSGSISSKQCPCRRALPLINYLEGRSEDFIVNENNESLSPRKIAVFFEAYPEIKYFQLIQKGLSKFQLFLVLKNKVYAGRGNSPAALTIGRFNEAHLQSGLKGLLGKAADIEIHFTKSIPAERSGKFRWVKREHQVTMLPVEEKINL